MVIELSRCAKFLTAIGQYGSRVVFCAILSRSLARPALKGAVERTELGKTEQETDFADSTARIGQQTNSAFAPQLFEQFAVAAAFELQCSVELTHAHAQGFGSSRSGGGAAAEHL